MAGAAFFPLRATDWLPPGSSIGHRYRALPAQAMWKRCGDPFHLTHMRDNRYL